MSKKFIAICSLTAGILIRKARLEHLKYFQKIMKEEGIGKIASLSGRFYAMDRAKNWKRLSMAYDAIVFAQGETANSVEEAIEKAYTKNLTDEYLVPTVILENGNPVAQIRPDDAVVFFNFRSDRARQFSKLFIAVDEKSILSDNMPVIDKIKNLYFVALTDFGPDWMNTPPFRNTSLDATLPMAAGTTKTTLYCRVGKIRARHLFLKRRLCRSGGRRRSGHD